MNAHDYTAGAWDLLARIGVIRLAGGTWAFTDVATASKAYIHHSSWPTALCAYAAVDPVFARGRLPGRTLIEMIHKVTCMDGAELTALALVCGAAAPTFAQPGRSQTFGRSVWENVARYELHGCFERVEPRTVRDGEHFALRPRGYAWALPDQPEIPEAKTALRKAFRALEPLRQIMAMTILHLYLTRVDKDFLVGGCKTQILAADAVDLMHRDGAALRHWGGMVSYYSGW